MKDITDKVNFDLSDGEFLPLTKCACGAEYELWNFILHMDKNSLVECLKCGRKMYFTIDIRVYEVAKEE